MTKKSIKQRTKKQPVVKEQLIDQVKLQQQSQPQPQTLNKPINKKNKTKNARIIIRNLVFDINEKHIRKLMAPYGQIKDLQIPKHPDKNISRGFAFVQLAKKNLCNKAIQDLNGSKYKGRTIVLDMAVGKDTYLNEKMENNQQSMDEESNEDPVKEENNEMEDEQEKDEQMDEEEQEEEQQQEQQQQQEEEQKIRKDHESQIFIRNVPISITEADLFKHFKKYGKIHFVKVVMNKQTNMSKGTAFIKFHDETVAQKLIEYSRGYELYLQKKAYGFKPDPTINLEMDGMLVKIFPVESRKSIEQKLQKRNEDEVTPKKKKPVKKIKKLQDLVKNDPHDKRRLSLALEGKWKAEEGMNKYDYEKFKNHEKQKLQKLKNPNNSISSTRIVLKFLDKSISQQDLKNFCLQFLNSQQAKHKSLTYCKLMLDASMKKSAGFAFIQFAKPQLSQQFVGKLTAQPQLLMNHPFVVEFAIQNSRKMLKLKNKQKMIK